MVEKDWDLFTTTCKKISIEPHFMHTKSLKTPRAHTHTHNPLTWSHKNSHTVRSLHLRKHLEHHHHHCLKLAPVQFLLYRKFTLINLQMRRKCFEQSREPLTFCQPMCMRSRPCCCSTPHALFSALRDGHPSKSHPCCLLTKRCQTCLKWTTPVHSSTPLKA